MHPRPWGARASTSRKMPNCAICREPLADPQRVRLRDDEFCHVRCYRCAHCSKELGIGEYASGNSSYLRASSVYCSGCFQELHGKECTLCQRRLLRWNLHGGLPYCPEHERQGLQKCFGCRRLIPPPEPSQHHISEPGSEAVRDAHGVYRGVQPDGRSTCKSCAASALVDAAEAQQLFRCIIDFYAALGVRLPAGTEEPTVELLDCRQLKARMNANQSLHAVAEGASCDACPLGLTSLEFDEWVGTETIVPSSRRVGGVSILNGLPRDLATHTLAHELGHV